MKIRSATTEDLPAVVKVILAGINNDRLWTDFVPAKNSQDAPYLQEIVDLLKKHIDTANKDWDVQVVDLASKGQAPEIVCVAVWDLSAASNNGSGRKPHETEGSLRDSRTKAYVSLVQQGHQERFSGYHQYRYLQLLATNPIYKDRGYATDLVRSAINEIKREGGVIVAIGGPVGYILFSSLGFEDLGPMTLPPSKATDAQTVKAMSLVVSKEERRRSLVDSLIGYISN